LGSCAARGTSIESGNADPRASCWDVVGVDTATPAAIADFLRQAPE